VPDQIALAMIVNRIDELAPELRTALTYAMDFYLDVALNGLNVSTPEGDECWIGLNLERTAMIERFYAAITDQPSPGNEHSIRA
jgi:hypothetical protein